MSFLFSEPLFDLGLGTACDDVSEVGVKPVEAWASWDSSFSDFNDYVGRNQMARMEGVLLRYLSQVYSTLVRSVPEPARTDEVVDVIGFLRAVIARIDSSLVEEWESMVHPSAAPATEPQPVERPVGIDWRRDRRALESRVRAELHQLVRALSRKDWGEAARVVGSVQIRNRATLAGNVCNGSPAADTTPPQLIYGAVVVVAGSDGERRVPIDDFIVGAKQVDLGRGSRRVRS